MSGVAPRSPPRATPSRRPAPLPPASPSRPPPPSPPRVRHMASGAPAPGAPPNATFATDDIRITAPNVDAEGLPPDLRKDCVLFYYPVS